MQLLPIPVADEYIKRLMPYWAPFLPDIAKRSKEPVADLIARISRKDVQLFLIWDEDEDAPANMAVAMLGVSYHRRGDDLIAVLEWTTGHGRTRWQGLLPELERYLKEHVGCKELRPVCRLGWFRFLRQHGYKATHITMEKVL